LQEAVSDPKYEGVRSSRQQIFDDSDHSQDEDEDEDDERDSLLDKFEQGDPGDEDVEDEDEDFGASEEEESTHAAQEDSDDEPIQVGNRSKRKSQQEADEIKPSDLSSSLKYTRVQDRAKGKAVSRQLVRLVVSLPDRI
jgi:protein AATF/BFR2